MSRIRCYKQTRTSVYKEPHLTFQLLARKRSERDTIRGIQIRVGTVRIYIYMYGGTYVIIVAHAAHT